MRLLLAASVCFFLLLACASSAELDAELAAMAAKIAAVEADVAAGHEHERRPVDRALYVWYQTTGMLMQDAISVADARLLMREALAFDSELLLAWGEVETREGTPGLFEMMLWKKYFETPPAMGRVRR